MALPEAPSGISIITSPVPLPSKSSPPEIIPLIPPSSLAAITEAPVIKPTTTRITTTAIVRFLRRALRRALRPVTAMCGWASSVDSPSQ